MLPATASAKVGKNYAKAYAARLRSIIGQEDTRVATYNAYAETLVAYATTLQDLLASPDPTVQETIEEYKSLAREAYDSSMSGLARECAVYETAIRRFHGNCRHMFSKSADRIRLRRWASQWVAGAGATSRAFNHLAIGFSYLSVADVPAARVENDAAIALVQHAAPRISKAQQGLRNLKR